MTNSPLQPHHEQAVAPMGVRIVDQLGSNIIPLHRTENPADPATCNTTTLVEAPLPEPSRLYGLTALAFLLHTPTRFIQRCVRCGTSWPCDHLRLAFRLREGF
jgi:hypothetical protein